jgi:hypothetical protein
VLETPRFVCLVDFSSLNILFHLFQKLYYQSVLNDPDYDPSLFSFHKTKDDIVKNMICVPVFDVEGRVIAVIQAINKLERGVPGRISNLMRRSTLSFGKSLRSKYSNRFLNCIL